jgi:hypothetical protein
MATANGAGTGRSRTWAIAVVLAAAAMAGCGDSGDEAEGESVASPTGPVEQPPSEPSSAVTSTAAPASTAAAPASFTVVMNEENASGRTGVATFRPLDDASFEVVIEAEGALAPEDIFYAGIHDQPCAGVRAMQGDPIALFASIANHLEYVMDNHMTAIVATPLEERTTGGYSVAFGSLEEPWPAYACGDIPAVDPAG